jgi:hypothetical protein
MTGQELYHAMGWDEIQPWEDLTPEQMQKCNVQAQVRHSFNPPASPTWTNAARWVTFWILILAVAVVLSAYGL